MIPEVLKRPTAILVVDDDPDMRMLLKTAIEWQGHTALLAQNGLEGFTICSMDSPVDVIVCDMDMPVMGGLAFIEKINAIRPEARVIASTGGDQENLRRARAFGVVRATLAKPYSIAAFWVTLERVLLNGDSHVQSQA